MQKVAILGSTGSIGRNTLDVIDRLAPRFQVVALSAGTNLDLVVEQAARYMPEIVSVKNEAQAYELYERMNSAGGQLPEILYGMEGMLAVATHPQAEVVVSATVGGLGLLPTYKAIELGRRVAIANKEPLVMAGELMTNKAKESGA